MNLALTLRQLVDGPDRRLRILHVLPTYYPAVRYGGPIRSVHALATAQAASGHDVSVYTTNVDGPGDMDFPAGAPVMRDGVAVHYFPVPALRRLYWSPQMDAALRRHVRDFDLLHLHSIFLWPVRAAARAAERAGVPYLMAPRGMLGSDVIRSKSRWAKTAWIRMVERRSLARAAALHVTSELEATDVRAMGLRLPRLRCVANGVAFPEDFAPIEATPYRALRRPYALFLSRLSWKKGLDRLVEAWTRVPDLDLVIAGNDFEGCQPVLAAQAQRLGIADRVLFLGLVDDRDKWALYAEAEMFLLPSYSENFGNVVAEAMAMACPVVVTDRVGLASRVRETECGVVVDGDPASLAEAVVRLHRDPALRDALGQRGLRAARERMSWEGVAREMDEVYFDVLRATAQRTD